MGAAAGSCSTGAVYNTRSRSSKAPTQSGSNYAAKGVRTWRWVAFRVAQADTVVFDGTECSTVTGKRSVPNEWRSWNARYAGLGMPCTVNRP